MLERNITDIIKQQPPLSSTEHKKNRISSPKVKSNSAFSRLNQLEVAAK